MVMIEVLRNLWRFRRWIGLGVAVLAFCLLYYSKTAVERDLAEEKLKNAEMATLVAEQNAKIADWEKVVDATMEYAAKARDEANAKAKSHNKTAQRILVEKPTRDDECAATLDLLRKYQ